MSDLVIRPLEGQAEYRACVALQRATWGQSFSEIVPPSMLMVSQEMGGIASGAFDGERLAGFVFGLSGMRDGRPGHWSDMLAVDPAYRGRGLGRRLKLHQRERLLGLGIEHMVWTFDPLVARNAHLNFNRLGITVRVYKRDAYGESDSPLHAGIGTDRLLADWAMASPRVVERIQGAPAPVLPTGPLLAEPHLAGPFPRPGTFRPAEGAPHVRVAVPSDIDALRAADMGLAKAWRANVREAMEWAFAAGYVAVGSGPGPGDTAVYTLSLGF